MGIHTYIHPRSVQEEVDGWVMSRSGLSFESSDVLGREFHYGGGREKETNSDAEHRFVALLLLHLLLLLLCVPRTFPVSSMSTLPKLLTDNACISRGTSQIWTSEHLDTTYSSSLAIA
jgi:hypothetical protein